MAFAQENKLRRNYETPESTYSNLVGEYSLRTATRDLSFQYYPPSDDPEDTAPDFENIQILYLNSPMMMSNMAFMSNSLGVECSFCHDLNDFASDSLPSKQRAREMIQWVLDLNASQGGIVFNCLTCHQGKTLSAQ